MNRIRLLPEHVANQIAAGEVVERPASVVKELVENALDAGATRISVEIQAGGRSLIRVTDDGLGMSRDDALMCLERHATSKILRAEDLSSISTMGFRGEALPSIASVGRMTLTTRERESEAIAATQIVIHGGKMLEVKEAGAPPGTSIELRQLFFNLPARRRFLRSDETEFAHIQHYLTLAALSHPGIGFIFARDGKTLWQLPAIATSTAPEIQQRIEALRQRVRGLFGNEEKLLELNFAAVLPRSGQAGDPADDDTLEAEGGFSPSGQVRLWGLIGQPGVSRSTRDDQFLFVNRRPIENRGLNFALLEGYHTALMKGRYPVCCLFLEIDPALVDVNIHPAKREVKFHNERAVRQLTAQAVREALLAYHGASAVSPPAAVLLTSPAVPAPPSPDLAPVPAATVVQPSPSTDLPGFSALTGTAIAWSPRSNGPTPSAVKPLTAPVADVRSPVIPGPPATRSPDVSRIEQIPAPATQPNRPAEPLEPVSSAALVDRRPAPLLSVPLRLVGVVGRLYVVLESDRGLVLMDQHAAHERVLFEQMLQRLESGTVPSQRLLLPETVELSVRDAGFLRQQLPMLNRLGVGVNEFGERTFLLDAVPPMVKLSDARRFVVELVDELKAAGQSVNSQRLGEVTIAKTVCRHAVKANDPLAGPELENLVQDLRQCSMPYTCPHGRPTLIEMNYRELEKKFGRLA